MTTKFILLLIPCLVILSLAAFSQKKVISITSQVAINATQSEIFDLLKNLERYPEWSPFVVTDPKQKHYVEGKNGEIGSTFHWEGVSEKSKGYQVLSTFKGNEYLKYDCTIIKPFKGNPVFEYHFNQKDGEIEVVQDFNLHLNGFAYFMTKLFGVKNKMIASNQLGLNRLKSLLEKEIAHNN
jgi:hypothetical protein